MTIKYVLLIFIIIFIPIHAVASVCDQTSILKEEQNVLLTCGFGRSRNRLDAEMNAYTNAIKVLKTHCESSAECRSKKYSIVPMRVKSYYGGGIDLRNEESYLQRSG